MLEEAIKNVEYKNVSPKNVGTFCKMLMKNNRNVDKKLIKN
jgi:(2Fe-2S) ferredoxin